MDATGKRGCTVNNLEEVIVSNAQSIFSIMENSIKRQRAEIVPSLDRMMLDKQLERNA